MKQVLSAGALVASGVLVSLAVVGLSGGPADAHPPAAGPGPTTTPTPPPPAAVPSLLVTGTLDGPARARQDGISLKVRGDVTVRDFTLTYPAGAVSGWHRHPGIVLATVEQGSVVQQVGCRTRTWTVGQSFTEVEPHQVSNAVTEPGPGSDAVLRITQLLPVGAVTRENLEPPRCGPKHRS